MPQLRRILVAIIVTFAIPNLALADGDQYKPDVAAVRQGHRDPLDAMWDGGKAGALVGVGAGASIALIDYAASGDTKPMRIIAGCTGAGFLVGATLGLISDRFGSELFSFGGDGDVGAPHGYWAPTVVAFGGGAGLGIGTTLDF